MTNRPTTAPALTVLLGFLLAGSALGADADVERLVRDQRTVKARLDKIEEKMERLEQKLRDEGKRYNADLLKNALAELREQRVSDHIDEVVPDLASQRFTSIERQEELLTRLESVYAILLDRNDYEKLEQRLQQIEAAIRDVSRLRADQRELIDETRALTESEQALLERAAARLEELVEQQQQLLDQTDSDESRADAAALDMKRRLDELAARQAEALDETEGAIESVAGAALERLDEAIEAEETALSRLADSDTLEDRIQRELDAREAADGADGAEPRSGTASPEEESGSPEPSESPEADEATETGETSEGASEDAASPESAGAEADAAETAAPASERTPAALDERTRDGFLADQERARRALERLARDELGRDPAGGREGAPSPQAAEVEQRIGEPIDRAAEAMARADAAARRGERSGAAEESARALATLKQAREELAEMLAGEPRATPEGVAETQDEIEAAAEELARELEQAGEPGTTQAARETEKAAGRAAEAREALERGDPVAASDAQRQALEALNAARSAMTPRAAKARSAADRLASKQDYVQRGMSELGETLDELSSLMGEDEEQRKRLDLRDEAEQEMASAREQLEQRDPSGAAKSQSEALDRMKQLGRSLEQASRQSGGKSQKQLALEEEEYEDLAERQKELEEKTRDLMERLKDVEDPAREQAMQNAAGRMDQARSQLSEQEGEQALPREEEAEKYLAQAQEQLENEQERYQNLRQEELLFKVREELLTLRKTVDEVHGKTMEIDLAREERDGRLSRSQRAQVKELGDESRRVKDRNDEVVEKIAEDGARVFTFTLEKNGEDLERLAGMLGTRPHLTDPFTQSIQIDVIERYDELLGALSDELERRKKAAQEPQGDQQQPSNGKRPLIPRVAELLMVRRMEENAMRKVDAFLRSSGELSDEGLDEISRERLVRLGHEHTEVTELFDSLVEEAQPTAPPDSESPDGEESK